MTGSPPRAVRRPSDLFLLARWRAVQFRNMVDQQLRDAPWRTLSVLLLLGGIWTALYYLLVLVFRQIGSWGNMVALLADQQIFVHFFLVLAVMLTFSNAILTFSTLYGRHEAGHLLSMPLRPRQVVCVKWLEGMVLSSWSFLLLGGPLMFAVARNGDVEWYYYPLFLAHFIGFVAIPACLGLLAACFVAMWAPHRPLVIALLAGTIVLLGGLYWLASLTRTADQTDQWVRALLAQLSLAKQPALPSTWTAKGIFAAIERNPRESLFYLGIVVGNALFASWVTINILGRTWPSAYSRAVQGRQVPFIRRGWLTELACLPARWLLPTQLHRVLLKDLRHFARDPKQWTQMLIMFGLLVIYVANLRRLPLDFDQPGVKSVMMFINLTAVSLILATFTSRFVFPMLSLESQQLWLLELLPIRRTTLLVMKFLFSLTLTTAAALIVMGAAVYMLGLPPLWALVSLGLCLSVCVGLSGLATGLGARFPVLGQRNPARIAAGFGGTFNLVVSMVFVMLVMAGVATLHLTENRSTLVINLPQTLSPEGVVILSLLLALGVVVAAGALLIGAHHFRRLET